MKKFFKWFKNSTKIKRWMFLIVIGLFSVCFGFSKILTQKELGIIDLAEIIITFILGFVFFVTGIVFIQRRTLEISLEENQIEADSKNVVNELVSKKGLYSKGPNIVVIGGGAGLNNVLKGLKNYTNNLTAIVSVASYGKAKTKASKELNLNSIEDIKDSIISLSFKDLEMKHLMNYKFKEGGLKDYTFAEIYLAAMKNVCGDFATSIQKSSDILAITGKTLPVSLDEMNICAELLDGTVVEEKNKIAQAVQEKVTKINRVYLNPTNCKVAPGVLEAIKNADAIVLGPGSLYTNVIPNLLVKNVSKTIKESKALKIYVANIMTEPGQTDDYTLSDHINSIVDHCGNKVIDFCIADIGAIVPEYVRKYNLMGSTTVEIDQDKIKNVQVIKGEYATIDENHIRHDSDKIANEIIEIICSDLKFKDKQSEEQYMLLNSRLKKEKEKIAKKKDKKVKKIKEAKPDAKHSRKASKFSTKYKDRINSIKESENTRQENIRIQKKAMKLKEEEEKAKFLEETYNKKSKK